MVVVTNLVPLTRARDCNGLTPVRRALPSYDPRIGGSGMSNQRYSPEFKDKAVRQIVDRGYSVSVSVIREERRAREEKALQSLDSLSSDLDVSRSTQLSQFAIYT